MPTLRDRLSCLPLLIAGLSCSVNVKTTGPAPAVRVLGQGVTAEPSIQDANDNGIEDTVDIVYGTSLDENLNGIPDEAEFRLYPAAPTAGIPE